MKGRQECRVRDICRPFPEDSPSLLTFRIATHSQPTSSSNRQTTYFKVDYNHPDIHTSSSLPPMLKSLKSSVRSAVSRFAEGRIGRAYHAFNTVPTAKTESDSVDHCVTVGGSTPGECTLTTSTSKVVNPNLYTAGASAHLQPYQLASCQTNLSAADLQRIRLAQAEVWDTRYRKIRVDSRDEKQPFTLAGALKDLDTWQSETSGYIKQWEDVQKSDRYSVRHDRAWVKLMHLGIYRGFQDSYRGSPGTTSRGLQSFITRYNKI
jgi:hypothetical protein